MLNATIFCELKFETIESELDLYIRRDIITGLYLGDILISGKDSKEIEGVKKRLSMGFKIKNF